jgi:Na+/phosphate symporter
MTLKDEILVMATKSEMNHLLRLREKKCSAEVGILYIELLGEVRKVSRHLANIAERSGAFHPQPLISEEVKK